MNQIATEIYNQLGKKALYMLGAKNVMFCNTTNALLFKISGSKAYNHITITYAADDTYTLRFVKFRGIDIKAEATIEGVYCDMLHSIIEQRTGLYTSL